MGLLSVIDALLDMPIADLVAQLPLPNDVAQALIHQVGPYGDQLKCVLALEHGNWHDPACGLMPTGELNALYINAMNMARQSLLAIN